MELQVIVPGKKVTNTLNVSENVFGQDFNEPLIHQVVTAYLAQARQGTKAQKNRSAVAGGGRKPWKQKGTGRARAGTIRSPIWVGGGRAFAASPRSFKQKVNKKMYRSAIRSILSELIRQGRLLVVEDLSLEQPKTKELVTKLKDLALNNVLIVTEDVDVNLMLAARNIVNVDVVDVRGVDPVSLVGYEKVLMASAAVKKIEENLG